MIKFCSNNSVYWNCSNKIVQFNQKMQLDRDKLMKNPRNLKNNSNNVDKLKMNFKS